MKKPFKFNELSATVRCCDCDKKIKLNVLARKGLLDKTGIFRDLRCNPCHHKHEAGRGHFMGKFGRSRKKLFPPGVGIMRSIAQSRMSGLI